MAEDWDSEIDNNSSSNFSLYPVKTDAQPKTSFLRYVRQIYGTDTAINVRSQLDSAQITDNNFSAWKQISFVREYNRRYNPPPSLLRKHYAVNNHQ